MFFQHYFNKSLKYYKKLARWKTRGRDPGVRGTGYGVPGRGKHGRGMENAGCGKHWVRVENTGSEWKTRVFNEKTRGNYFFAKI